MKALTHAIIAAVFIMMPAVTWGAPDYGAELKLAWESDPGTFKMLRTDWSQNGSWIVFEFRQGAKADIMMVDAKGGKPVNLSDGSADMFMSPRFSLNDNVVLYTRFLKGTDLGYSMALETVDIISGDRETQVINGFGSSFSPDGKYLTYINTASPDNPFMQFTVKNVNDNTLVIHDNYGLTTDFVDCCFHPSGTWVAATFKAGTYKLYKVPLDGAAPTVIVPEGKGEEWYPSFSPLGTRLLYTQFIYSDDRKTFSRQVYVADVATGASVPLVPDAAMETHSASYSPDGKTVCYILETSTGPKLYQLAVEPESGTIGQLGVASEKPSGFGLTGNYPNPFNPATAIGFTLESHGQVHLSVYSLSGQKVRELVSGEMTAGSHSVVWDGKDARGTAVSSGVYIVNLKSGDRSASKKVTLLR